MDLKVLAGKEGSEEGRLLWVNLFAAVAQKIFVPRHAHSRLYGETLMKHT